MPTIEERMPRTERHIRPQQMTEVGAQSPSDKHIRWIAVASVSPNPNQPRRIFDEQALEELASSIREIGLIQPITVRALDNDRYELVSGERRLRACARLGKTHIDAIVLPASTEDSAMMALIENLQRADLHFLEEAEGYAMALQEFRMSQEEMAQRIGRSQSAVANKLRLLRLSDAVRSELRAHALTERHARALLKLSDEQDRLAVARQAAERELNVRQTEALVAQTLERQRAAEAPQSGRKVITLMRDHRLYLNAFRDIVQQMQRAGIHAEYTVQDRGEVLELRVILPRSHVG